MNDGRIIQEVRAARDRLAAECGYDIDICTPEELLGTGDET